MTNKDAKARWCPMVRFVIGPQSSTWQEAAFTNRGDVYSPNKCTCLADDCACWVATNSELKKPSKGRCGLTR